MMSAAAIMIFILRSVRECSFRQPEVNTPASVGSHRQANAFRTRRPGNPRETPHCRTRPDDRPRHHGYSHNVEVSGMFHASEQDDSNRLTSAGNAETWSRPAQITAAT